MLTQRTQDVRRALDFLETRPDVDRTRLAFYSLSMGADMGPLVGAVDDRLRTLVLVAGGLDEGLPPEVDAINFAPRVRVPVLMVNGRYDFTAPYETSQVPALPPAGVARQGQEARGVRQRPRSPVARRRARDARLAGPAARAGHGKPTAQALTRGALYDGARMTISTGRRESGSRAGFDNERYFSSKSLFVG